MISVAALTQGAATPSARFRVRQHIGPLRSFGVIVTERPSPIDASAGSPWGATRGRFVATRHVGTGAWAAMKVARRLPSVLATHRADVTWLQRPLLPGYPTLESLLSRPLIFDIDDAVWLRPPFGDRAVAMACRRASIVVAGNNYLAEWAASHTSDVVVVPTAIDTDRFAPIAQRVEGQLMIGWTGSSSTLAYLEAIGPPLARAIDALGARLVVVADVPPRLREVPAASVTFVPWTAESEATVVRQMDIGLMPLPDDAWTRGKCAFKLLQYGACGVPSVASPVGASCDLLDAGAGLGASSPEEWVEALVALGRDEAMRRATGDRARVIVEERYSARVVSAQLASIITRAVG